MAMTINLTLAVQIVNFLIAYFLLSRFLFRPGYESIKSDENRLHQLRSSIAREQENLAQKQEYKRKRWQHCQNYFRQQRPVLESEVHGIVSTQSITPLPALGKKEIEIIASDVAKKIEKQVLHD